MKPYGVGLVIAGIAISIFGAIELVPWAVASVSVSEYMAHDWYCLSTGGKIDHVSFDAHGITIHDQFSDTEQCVY